ncbi:MAG: hypothetical protein NTY09_05275 [bacterium]|nr:hypothetical protein [bacterium]
MKMTFRIGTILVLLIAIVYGCTSRQISSEPVIPNVSNSQSETENLPAPENGERMLLGYSLLHIDISDPDHPIAEFMPDRSGSIHLNILKLLETGVCTDCFKIVGLVVTSPGVVDVDIRITHPFPDWDLTVFDVRGIIMFDGNRLFPASGLTISDSTLGDAEFLNAEGYTKLYNGSTQGLAWVFQTYYKGKHATDTVPNALLNGYIRHITDDPLNTRNALYPAGSVTRKYTLKLPVNQLVLGYAVDANWELPLNQPVQDPMTDFGIEANSPEPWKIDVHQNPIGSGLTESGGETVLSIDVYDWQGKDTHGTPAIECPELFDGTLNAPWVGDGTDFSTYAITISNSKPTPVGTYKCLVSVEDNDNATSQEWLDLTAYKIVDVKVNPSQPDHHELWYYHGVNLLPDQSLQDAKDLLQTAKDAGYTQVVLADFKLGTSDIQSQTYWDHLQDYADTAAQIGIEVIPSLVPVGYSDAVLCHDPNLIEGQPVYDCTFKVNGSTASVVQDPATAFVNGNFEQHSGDDFTGWNIMDGPGVVNFADSSVVHSGSTSIRFENFTSNQYGHARIRQEVQVKPWNCYAVSFWLKSSALSPTGGFNVLVFDQEFDDTLEFLNYDINSTQDWVHYYTIFNSQDNTSVNIYFGMWGGESGQFWIDDVTIENAGLINLIRRDGAPLTVTNNAGTVTYQEGVDFDYVEDPLMGHAGSYTGTFDLYHEHPVITLTPGSAINNGDTILADYYHCTFVYAMQPACCLTEPAVFDIFQSTLSKVNELIHPSRVFIGVDELRVVNWCNSCQSTGKTPGQLLADATQQIDQIAHQINPDWKLITWSDMYDPNHNAVDGYYLSNGTLAGSWEGLPQSWDIGNWYQLNTDTLAWFGSLGNRQILCGYYDESGPDFSITDWLDLSKNTDGVYACMYTTWWKGFDDLVPWAQAVKDWDAANW